MTVPELAPLAHGRWQARCQFCKTESIPVTAVDAADPRQDLEKMGWVVYESTPGAPPRALCNACGVKNEQIMAEVKAARKHRRRK